MKRAKRALFIIGIGLLIICIVIILLKGPSYTLKLHVDPATENIEDYQISIDQDKEIVNIIEKHLENETLCLTLHSVSKGRAYIRVHGPNNYSYLESIYVHPLGIITINEYFGNFSGNEVIPIAVTLYMVLILLYVILQYQQGMKQSLYQYKNIRNLGWIIYVSSCILGQMLYFFSGDSLVNYIKTMLNTASFFSFFAFPAAFIVYILVTISNVQLIRKEGRNWRNTLGFIMGLVISLGTIFPYVLSEFLQRANIADVYNKQGIALYIKMAVNNSMLVVVTYLECILISTIVLSIIAAKKIPSFDKDYILILGCQNKKDGTLTPLLKGRTDRALEFSDMQEKASGKKPVFVPCGGKGEDEIISEAQSITNYLVEIGVPAQNILKEDQSANTYENLQNSALLIKKHSKTEKPKIAFSTTNYHVFRAGILAEQQGIHVEGIGSKTRSYFWINSFVREFIATVYAERKKHLRVIIDIILVILYMVFIVYLSNVL